MQTLDIQKVQFKTQETMESPNMDSKNLEGHGGDLPTPEDAAEMKRKERRLKWKVDLTILPLLTSVYFLAQMGRSDLGNAKIAGMDDDLGLSPGMYSNVSSIFLVGYLAFQLPGTLLLKKIGGNLQFGVAMISWGIVTACTVEVQNYASLMVVRALVGVCDAFVQGCLLYISFFYNNNEIATRGAIFFSMSAVAGAFNGLIAYAIQQDLEGVNGWSAWRWIFFIEGMVPIVWGFVIIFCLPPSCETIRWGFTEDEKDIIKRRARAAHNTAESKIRLKLLFKLLADPCFWPLVLMNCGTHFCLSSMSNFLPDILSSFGWSTVKAQIMSVIVYGFAVVSVLTCCRLADKLGQRGLMIVIASCIAVVGYTLLLTCTAATARFAATCIVAIGVYPNIVLILAWMVSITIGYTYRAGAAGIINVIAQLISISGNQAYRDPPLYRTGHSAALAMMAITGLTAAAFSVWLRVLNKRKRLRQDTEEAALIRGISIDDIGNKHPDFFYGY